MKKKLFAAAILVAACGNAIPTLAVDPESCLDCHEPSEDWAGMSTDEMVIKAKDLTNKRHADHADISDEQMKVIIIGLMPE